MADVDVVNQVANRMGLEVDFTTFGALAVADNYKIPNKGNRTALLVETGANATTVTIVTTKIVDGDLAVEDREVDVAANELEVIGFLDKEWYSAELDVSFSVITNVKVAAVEFEKV